MFGRLGVAGFAPVFFPATSALSSGWEAEDGYTMDRYQRVAERVFTDYCGRLFYLKVVEFLVPVRICCS